MIISFKKNSGGGGSGEDTQLRASAYTQVELSSANTLSFKNSNGIVKGSVNLGDNFYDKATIDAGTTAMTEAIVVLQGIVNGKVGSTSVSTIWKGTQAEYDVLPSYDANTLYLIEEE